MSAPAGEDVWLWPTSRAAPSGTVSRMIATAGRGLSLAVQLDASGILTDEGEPVALSAVTAKGRCASLALLAGASSRSRSSLSENVAASSASITTCRSNHRSRPIASTVPASCSN